MKIFLISLLVCGTLVGSYGYRWAQRGYGQLGYGHGGYGQHGYGHGGLYQAVSSHHGNTAFAYNDGLSTRKEHINADGTVSGSYSVIDANGNKRTVNYKAGANGFEVDGDTGVDKATADAAAKLADAQADLQKQADALAEQAPKAPESPDAELPVAPTNPPDYGLRNKIVAAHRNGYYGQGHGHGLYGHGHSGLGYGHSYSAGYGLGDGYGVAINHGYYKKPAAYSYGNNYYGAQVAPHAYGHGHGLHGHGLHGHGYHGLRAYQNAVNAKLAQQQEDLNQQAAELAKQAPEAPAEAPVAPEVPAAELPVAPTNPPEYGLRNKIVYSIRNRGYGHHGYGLHGAAAVHHGGQYLW